MAVCEPATSAKSGGHKCRHIQQIIVVFNTIFCSGCSGKLICILLTNTGIKTKKTKYVTRMYRLLNIHDIYTNKMLTYI